VILYLPGASRVTRFPAFLSVIVNPGPVVPVIFVAEVPAGADSGSASPTTTEREMSARFNFAPSFERHSVFYVAEAPSGWVEVDGALEREFRFADFAEALAFVNRVGELAEEANHHPDIEISWNRVRLRWWTHVTSSITDRDRELAERSGGLV
jgi:4a-hydroxytetrahydrobiopterin dehydratase